MGNNLVCQKVKIIKKCCYNQPNLLYEANIINLNSERQSNLLNRQNEEIPPTNIKEIMEGNKIMLSALSMDKSNREEVQNIQSKGKKLKLKIIKSNLNDLKEGHIITIVPSGMIGTKRAQTEGYTFFGCKRNDVRSEDGEKVILLG